MPPLEVNVTAEDLERGIEAQGLLQEFARVKGRAEGLNEEMKRLQARLADALEEMKDLHAQAATIQHRIEELTGRKVDPRSLN